MTLSYSGSASTNVRVTVTSTAGSETVSSNAAAAAQATLTGISKHYVASHDLVVSTPVVLDLTSGLSNAYGSVTFATLKRFTVINLSSLHPVTIGGGTTPIIPAQVIPAGGWVDVCCSLATGVGEKLLSLDPGGFGVSVKVLLLGA